MIIPLIVGIGIILIIISLVIVNKETDKLPRVYEETYIVSEDFPRSKGPQDMSTKDFIEYLVTIKKNIEFPEKPKKEKIYKIDNLTYLCIGLRLDYRDIEGWPVSSLHPVLLRKDIVPVTKAEALD